MKCTGIIDHCRVIECLDLEVSLTGCHIIKSRLAVDQVTFNTGLWITDSDQVYFRVIHILGRIGDDPGALFIESTIPA